MENRKSVSLHRYKEALSVGGEERLVSGSDDFTLFLWEPSKDKKPIGKIFFLIDQLNRSDGRLDLFGTFGKALINACILWKIIIQGLAGVRKIVGWSFVRSCRFVGPKRFFTKRFE